MKTNKQFKAGQVVFIQHNIEDTATVISQAEPNEHGICVVTVKRDKSTTNSNWHPDCLTVIGD